MRLLMPTLVALCLGGGAVLASETPRTPATGPSDPHAAAAVPAKAAREPASPAPAGVAEKPAQATTAPGRGRPPTTGGKAAGKPAAVSPTELALRLQKILDGEAARQQHEPGHAVAPVTRRPLPKPAPAARPKPTPLLSWGSEPRPLGVALTWDRDIDPRRSRPAPAGVRLTWADVRD